MTETKLTLAEFRARILAVIDKHSTDVETACNTFISDMEPLFIIAKNNEDWEDEDIQELFGECIMRMRNAQHLLELSAEDTKH